MSWREAIALSLKFWGVVFVILFGVLAVALMAAILIGWLGKLAMVALLIFILAIMIPASVMKYLED